MKKNLVVFLTVLVIFGVTACNNATQRETNNTQYEEATAKSEKKEDYTNYDKISKYMEKECKDAFSQHYELLDFEIINYQEKVVNGNTEATFFYKLIYKNYDKDPDTVGYIKEAKERGNSNYQQMYDEYLQPKEMNFDLKAILHQNDFITLYSNISPKGIEWEETIMTDFIIKK